MREQQFIRFVEQICYLLRLSQPCSKTALQYFMQFKEYENHAYDQEILVAACIYLSVKIFQEQVRIRDILNMVYVLTSLYKMSAQQAYLDRENKKKQNQKQKEEYNGQKIIAEKPQQYQQPIQQQQTNRKTNYKSLEKIQTQQNQSQANNPPIPQQQSQAQQQQPYILLKNIQHMQNLHELIQPKYSLSDYNEYKGKIIEAEQMLLRILGFSFSLSQQNKKELKRLLIVIHYLRIPSTVAQTIINVYNDIHYIDIDYWPEGIVYFAYLVTKVFVHQKLLGNSINVKNNNLQKENLQIKRNPQNLQAEHNAQNLQLQEFQSTGSLKKPHDKQTAQIQKINQFISLMTTQKWQALLATDIKLLENYAEKLANFYSSINPHS